MATYSNKYNLINFYGYTKDNNQKHGVSITDACFAELGFVCEAGAIVKLYGISYPIGNATLNENSIDGNTYGWSDMPSEAAGTWVDGGSDNPHFFDNIEIPNEITTKYRIAIYLHDSDVNGGGIVGYDTENGGPVIEFSSGTSLVSAGDGYGFFKYSNGSGSISGLTFNNYKQICRGYLVNQNYDISTEISSNIPIFDTKEHATLYCQNPAHTEGLLNGEADPEEEYEKAREYKYAWNIYGHNTQSAAAYTGFRNYRFYGGDGKICFYRVKATESSPFTVKLYNYQSYTIKAAGVHDTDDDDFETINNPELYFLNHSIQFSDNNYYTKFKFNTDLLVFGSESQAQMWVDDLIDARAAENFNEVSRAYNEIVDPGYGNPDPGNDNGVNGQSYVHGARMWVMSSSQLNHFFDDIFDPANITDILNGTKLFGSNEIGAIQGIAYFPIDIDDVATVYSSAQPIKIGSYQCPTAEGRYVQNNNKLIDCGSLFIAPVYNDFRDYRIKLYISLPYCGFHCLDPISKYMGKTLSVKYAVDITTGGCTAYVYADGIYLGDSFDGFMASQRPLSGLDQTAYLNSVMGCVSSMVSRETGMLNTAAEGIAGAASGKVSGGVGPGGAIETSAGAFGDIYKLSQAVKDIPMQTRGGFAGCLGFFGNQKIHIVTAQSKTVKPTLEQPLVGYPSHVSQTVGQFSGYLKCSYFKMANGFNGTLEELKEIIEMMQGGVYL